MSQLKLCLLGIPRIEVNGKTIDLPRRKAIALLAYLTVTQQPQRRDTLVALLWPESGQQSARASLRRELHSLIQIIGEGWLTTTRETIQLDPEANVWVDTEDFRRFVAAADDAAEDVTLVDGLTRAAALYRGDFLAGFTFSDCPELNDWQLFEAAGLRSENAGVLQRLVQLHAARDEYDPAIDNARRWLALDPTHEPVHRELMRLFALAGQQTAAARQYDECVRILDEELGVVPEAETTQLFESIRTRRFPVKDKPSPSPPSPPHIPSPPRNLSIPHNLNPQSSPFIGRDEDLAAVQNLLLDEADCRLLTLLGPGGIGKTRLSLQVGQCIVDGERLAREDADGRLPFPDGIYFVPLASISDVSYMVRAIADALGFQFRGSGEPQSQLEGYLAAKQLLLIIDNFEHLLDGAELLSSFLQHAPQLTLLVTSREALNLQEEWLYPLGGLTVPTSSDGPDEIAENPAVQLFMQRARQADGQFSLNDDLAAQVVRICQLVDGMPLGLELAAAWVQMLTVEEIADEITINIDILASEMRNIPERHRSLRAVFEQTWQRLTETEQATLSRLAVFRGTFTREAAQQVVNATLLDMASLVDKALCRQQAGRYDLHELLRQFAFERIDSEEQQTVQVQHSQYYGEMLDAQRQHIMTAAEMEMLQTISDDFDNMLAAWTYLLERLQIDSEKKQCAMLLRRCAPLLAAYFDGRALFWEGQHTFKQAHSILTGMMNDEAVEENAVEEEAVQALNVQIQIEQSGLNMTLGRYPEAKAILFDLLQSLRSKRDHGGDPEGDQRQLAQVLNYLGRAQYRTGNYADAEQYLSEAMEHYSQLDLPLEGTLPMINMGMVKSRSLHHDEARTLYQRAIAIYEEVGYATGLARCLSNIGSAYSVQTNFQKALPYYEQSYAIARESKNELWIGINLAGLGGCHYGVENYAASAEQYAKALDSFREMREMRWVTVVLGDASFSLIALNDLVTPCRYLPEALHLAQEHQLILDGLQALAATALLLEQAEYDEPAMAIATHLLDDERTRVKGRNHCEKLVGRLAEKMTEPAYAAAQFRGRSTPFELMVKEAIQHLEQVLL